MLRKIIGDRMKGNFHVYDRNGRSLPSEMVVREYQAIKNYLLSQTLPSDTIAIKVTKDYRYLLTMLASMEINLAYIPMMVNYPDHRVEQIREDANFKLLVTDELLESMINSDLPQMPLPPEDPDSTAYAIFTSGSTGKPKGVMIPRKGLENFLQWIGQEFTQLGHEDHMLQIAEFTFDLSVLDVGAFLMKNVQLHFTDSKHDIFGLAYEIENYKITTLSTVPNNLSMLFSDALAEKVNLGALKNLMIGGARFSWGLYNKCLERLSTDTNIYNLYGPTECTVYSHNKKLSLVKEKDCYGVNIAIGQPLLNIKAIIVKDDKVSGPRQEGELLLGGVQLMQRYMNNPEKTREALVEFRGETWYRTGDIAFTDEKGDYYIIGRLDDTIKSRGFRINLLDIDSYVNRLPYVEDCATIAVPHDIMENQIVAFIRLKEPKTVKELKRDLLEFMLDYQIPEKIIFVDNYPTNSSGKICKKTLKENHCNSHHKQA